MNVTSHRRWQRGCAVAGSALAVALLASACSSSGHSSATSAAAATGSGAGGATSVTTHSGPMGTFLTDSAGRSLYMFASDTATKSSCSAVCIVYWPPLTTNGTVTASGTATSGKLTTITRSDGTKQVVYAGHPLYYYKSDKAAGDTKGQGSTMFGAKWWLLAPSGSAITAAANGSAATSGGSSSGGSSTSGGSSSSGGSYGGGGGGWG